MVLANPAMLHVGTWNIHWFPRRCDSNTSYPDKATDIPGLACTMAWMHADLYASQEILTTPDAAFSLSSLRAELDRLTGASWHVDLQSCGGTSDQPVGFLWNGPQVALGRLTDVWECRARSRQASPVCQMFLHFDLGIAVVVADLMDVEDFMEAVSFDDYDKDPAFRVHGLQPGDEFPNFHGAPSWRLSCGVGCLRCVLIIIAYRALQDRDSCAIAV